MAAVATVSLADYHQMIDAGAFDEGPGNRVELIRGEIRQMSPIGSEHSLALARLIDWSYGSLPPKQVWLWTQGTINLPEQNCAPEPDLAWLVRKEYGKQNPPTNKDVLLLIEVAESSLEYDRGDKAALYAAAAIADYWIVDLINRRIEVRRDASSSGYRQSMIFAGGEEIRPLAYPDIALTPAMLFGQ